MNMCSVLSLAHTTDPIGLHNSITPLHSQHYSQIATHLQKHYIKQHSICLEVITNLLGDAQQAMLFVYPSLPPHCCCGHTVQLIQQPAGS